MIENLWSMDLVEGIVLEANLRKANPKVLYKIPKIPRISIKLQRFR